MNYTWSGKLFFLPFILISVSHTACSMCATWNLLAFDILIKQKKKKKTKNSLVCSFHLFIRPNLGLIRNTFWINNIPPENHHREKFRFLFIFCDISISVTSLSPALQQPRFNLIHTKNIYRQPIFSIHNRCQYSLHWPKYLHQTVTKQSMILCFFFRFAFGEYMQWTKWMCTIFILFYKKRRKILRIYLTVKQIRANYFAR